MRYIFFLLLLASTSVQAQWKSYIIGVKGDTLNRVDMKGMKQGPWVIQVPELRGERGHEEEGNFLNDKKTGTWRSYSLQGDILAIENYRFGHKDGRNVYFNQMGGLLKEENWRAVDPQNPYDTVDIYDVNDPSKLIRKEIIKLESATVKHGTWKYYDPMSGRMEAKEEWVFNRLKADPENDELAPINVTDAKPAAPKAVTKPKAVMDFEKKNAGKKKIRVRDGATGG